MSSVLAVIIRVDVDIFKSGTGASASDESKIDVMNRLHAYLLTQSVNNFAALIICTTVGRVADSMRDQS